jgi:nicotinamidase-related amidase
LLKPKAVTVFGVALDFCVYYVLQGLAKHSGIRLVLLKDVVRGLGARPEKEILDEFRHKGVEITRFSDLVRQLSCG